MKALTEVISDFRKKAVESGKVTMTQFTEGRAALKASGANDPTEEQLLHCDKETAKKFGFVESSRPAIKRNNGAGVATGESTTMSESEARIAGVMKNFSYDYRRACAYLGLKDPGANAREPQKFVEARKERLKKFYGPLISEADITTLAERGIEP